MKQTYYNTPKNHIHNGRDKTVKTYSTILQLGMKACKH